MKEEHTIFSLQELDNLQDSKEDSLHAGLIGSIGFVASRCKCKLW
jgi:hypothetical protein